MTLSDLQGFSVLAKHSMTRSIARPLCDIWASCSVGLKGADNMAQMLQPSLRPTWLIWTRDVMPVVTACYWTVVLRQDDWNPSWNRDVVCWQCVISADGKTSNWKWNVLN